MNKRLLLVCLLALGVSGSFAQPAELPKKEFTEKTSESIGKLGPLVEAKDFTGALALVDSILPAAPVGSFDTYVLNQLKAQILLTQGKLTEAISPMETALALAEGNSNFFEAASNLEHLSLLGQLHYQAAAESKVPAVQKAGYEKALAYNTRWLERSTKPTVEVRIFGASLLYQLATLTPKPDESRIREAIVQAREAMLLSVTPPNQLIQILVACHLQIGENNKAAELLEQLALRDPKSSNTWSQLQSIYMAAAGDTKDLDEARRQNLRAIYTLDRAQAQGLMNTPRDHYTKVAVLFNIQQYTRAAQLLEKGFSDNSIEPSKRNWELLASAYQQTAQDEKALGALTRASAKFPDDGALEFSLAQFLYNTGKVLEAYERGQSALKKGVEKRGQSEVYLAYLAYELQRYDEASKWVDAARASGDVPATTLDPLTSAISEAKRAREEASKS